MASDHKANEKVVDDLQIVSSTVTRVADAHGSLSSANVQTGGESLAPRVAMFHKALTRRFMETSKATITLYKTELYGAAITLTQSAVRTTAALWQLHSKVDSAIRRSEFGSLEEHLRRIYANDLPAAQRRALDAEAVSSFLEQADDHFPRFGERCQRLMSYDRADWSALEPLYDTRATLRNQNDSIRNHVRGGPAVELMAAVLKIAVLAYEHVDRELVRETERLSLFDARAQTAADTADQDTDSLPQPQARIVGRDGLFH